MQLPSTPPVPQLDEVLGITFRATAHRTAIERAMLRNGERFLEAAVGSGPTFVPLARQNPHGENVGVDTSASMLRRCRARLEKAGARSCRLEQADARSLPLAADSFDLVLCCFLLDSLAETDQRNVLAEFHRVLGPGGRLILAHMTHGGLPLYEHLVSHAPSLLGGCRPVCLGPRLLELGFRDVSQIPYRRLGFAWELVRGVKI